MKHPHDHNTHHKSSPQKNTTKMPLTRSLQMNPPPVSKENIKRIQGVVGSILFWAHSVDSTFLVSLNSIAIQQTSATYITLKRT